MADNLWLGHFQKGTAAARPTTPELTPGSIGFYHETDTGALVLVDGDDDTYTDILFVGADGVAAPTTVTGIATGKLSTIGGTAAKTYVLEAPVAGLETQIFCDSASTVVKTVTSSVNIKSTVQSTIRSLAFNTLGACVMLKGESTAAWVMLANNGAAES